VGSYDFKLHCVDAATGKTNWVYETGNYINGSPAVFEGKTAFGGCDAILHVISLANGEKVKEIEAGAYIAASVAVADNRAYFGHYENEFLCIDIAGETRVDIQSRLSLLRRPRSPKTVSFLGPRQAAALRETCTGESVWTFATQGKVDSSPVVVGESWSGRTTAGSVVSLGRQQVWSYEIGKPVGSSPAVVDGKL
jgi:outer membrane protein assembly factor BamB